MRGREAHAAAAASRSASGSTMPMFLPSSWAKILSFDGDGCCLGVSGCVCWLGVGKGCSAVVAHSFCAQLEVRQMPVAAVWLIMDLQGGSLKSRIFEKYRDPGSNR